MNKTLIIEADANYQLAEQKAARYFALLYEQVKTQVYVPDLMADIQLWQRKHVQRRSWLSLLPRRKRQSHAGDDYRYIQWLRHTNKLGDYLDRSVSYMYMRDLGKA